MAAYSSAFRQRLYFQLQGENNFRTIPNASGTWTSTGTQPILYSRAQMTPGNQVVRPQYKTGSASQLAGTRGRNTATFNYSGPWMPSGSPGTKPSLDPLLVSMTGQAATVVTSTSVTYSSVDKTIPFLAIKYDEGASGLTQEYSMGTLPTSVSLTLTGDNATISADCACVGIGKSESFSYYAGTIDAVMTGGLSAFPVEPTGLSIVGSTVPGLGIAVSIDGSAMSEVRGTLTAQFQPGYEFIDDGVVDGYRLIALNGARTVQLSNFTMVNSDRSQLAALKEKARKKIPVPVVLQSQTTAGLITTINLNNVQFPEAAYEEAGAAININFNNATAAASNFGMTDDFSIVLT